MKREKSSVFHMLFPWLLIVFIFLACFFLFNIFEKAAEFLESKRSDGERLIAQKMEEERERLKTRLEREKEEEATKLKLGYEETIKRLVAEKHALKERMERESAEKFTALRQEVIANSISRKQETDARILRLSRENDDLKERLERRNEEQPEQPEPPGRPAREAATDSFSRKQETDALVLRLSRENEELKERLERRNAEQPEQPEQPAREAAADSSSRKQETDAIIQQLRQENEALKKRLERQGAENSDQTGMAADPKDSAVIDEFKRDSARIIAKIEQLIQKKLFRQADQEITRWDLPPLADEMLPVKGALKEAVLFEHARKVPAKNIYLNILLYEQLSRLNPGKTLYSNKLKLYREKHRTVYGKEKDTSDCYDRGYLQGRCMILSTLGVSCGLDDETRIPGKCEQGRDAFLGMKKGVASMGR